MGKVWAFLLVSSQVIWIPGSFTAVYVLNPDTCMCSFSFSYFIHGESAVCTSIDVRQHPPVRRLTHAHIAAATSLSASIQVSSFFKVHWFSHLVVRFCTVEGVCLKCYGACLPYSLQCTVWYRIQRWWCDINLRVGSPECFIRIHIILF